MRSPIRRSPRSAWSTWESSVRSSSPPIGHRFGWRCMPTFIGCPATEVMREAISDSARGARRCRAGGSGADLRRAVDIGPDHAGGARAPAAQRICAAAHLRQLTELDLLTARTQPADLASSVTCPYCGSRQHDPRESLRSHPVPRHLPLRGLHPAVRGLQADLVGPARPGACGTLSAHGHRRR